MTVVQFPRRPDPDVRYSAMQEFEPTAGDHVITVSIGKHRDGHQTIAILMIFPDGCDEQMEVLAEWPAGSILPSTVITIADVARRAAGYACIMVPAPRGGRSA